MNHLGSRVMSLLLAILFLLGAAGVSFYAVFKGTPVFAVDTIGDISIVKVDNSTTQKLTTTKNSQTITLQFTHSGGMPTVTAVTFDAGQGLVLTGGSQNYTCTTVASPPADTYEMTLTVKLNNVRNTNITGKITLEESGVTKEYTFNLSLSEWLRASSGGGGSDVYYLQSYIFRDRDGDPITALTKGKRIDELILTICDGGFTADAFNEARGELWASLNYTTFEQLDRDEEPIFSKASELDNGMATYTITFRDLRYTGETRELQLKVGYPSVLGLERREFTETIPEGKLYVKDTSSSSSEESSSEVEIDPPTPRLIITSYDYGGQSVAAASTATLKLTFQNVSKRVPVDNVVLKITMPEAFTLTNSSNTFYFERVGREREETVSINFTVKPTAEAISQAIKLNFAYETVIANKRTPLTSDEEIAIPVTQVNRMTLNAVDVPPEVYIGDNSASIESTFVNKGKTAVYNVTASIEGKNLAQQGQTQFIGNVESGIEKSADFTIEGLEAGPITGEIILSYEDANMKVTELRTPFSTKAVEMDMGPTQEELDAMNQPQTEPVESTAWYETIPAWYWAVGGLVGIILLAYLIKLSRVSRLTLLEDDDEDF